jgi:hypothetical protein
LRPVAGPVPRIGGRRAKTDWREVCAQGVLLVLAAATVAVWVYTKPIVFTQDTFTYIHHARELQLRTALPGALFSRTPGFPLVLLLFHVTDLKQSVFWLIIFHSVLAVASCWLFYLTARLLEPRGALVLSLVFMGSMLPFLNVKYMMTEQSFLFETVLTLYGLVGYLMARTQRDAKWGIVVLSIGAALMTLTRPQGAYVIPVLFALAAVLAWRRIQLVLIGGVMVVGAVWFVQAVDQRIRSDPHSLVGSLDNSRLTPKWFIQAIEQRIRSDSQSSAGSLDNSRYTGPMLFFSLYLDGARANIRIRPENGPKSAELNALLLDELAKPDTLARRGGYLKSVPPSEVPSFLEKSFAEPDSNFFNMLAYTALNERLGPAQAERLLVQVCVEAMLAYPLQTAWLLFDKGFSIYFNPLMLVTPAHGQFDPGAFQSPLAEEVAAAGDYTNPTSTDFIIDNNLRWLMRAAILIAIVTLPIALRSSTWRVTLALLIFALYLNFAVVVGNTALFRYAIYAIPIDMMCAYIGIVATVSILRDRYLKKSAVATS